MKRNERILDSLVAGMLTLTGIAGYFVVFLDFIGTDFENGPWNWLKGPLPIILLITATLALALGLERLVRFQKLDQRINNLEQILEQSVGGRHLSNRDEVYQTAEWLLDDVEEHIRVTILSRMEEPSPKPYTDKFVEVLKQSKKSLSPIRVDMVIYGDFQQDKKNIQRVYDSLTLTLEKKQVRDLMSVYVADVAWGVDFLILDDQHLLLAFPFPRGIKDLLTGIAFINQKALTNKFSQWFDDFLLKSAIPYKEFEEKSLLSKENANQITD